jgi:hypothetical protein
VVARESARVISVETLLVALLGGLSGGVLGTWLQIRHEREEAFRERLITAADDLSTGLLQAIIGLDTAHTTCIDRAFLYPPDPERLTFRDPNTGEMPAESAEALRRSRELIREVEARRARISLLFGPVSAPDATTTVAVFSLEEAQHALEHRPLPDLGRYSELMRNAREGHRDFNRRALTEVRGRPWFARWRIVMWARRRLRLLWSRLRELWGRPR